MFCKQDINELFIKIASDNHYQKNIQLLYQLFINIAQFIQVTKKKMISNDFRIKSISTNK